MIKSKFIFLNFNFFEPAENVTKIIVFFIFPFFIYTFGVEAARAWKNFLLAPAPPCPCLPAHPFPCIPAPCPASPVPRELEDLEALLMLLRELEALLILLREDWLLSLKVTPLDREVLSP